jgi:hypothetical protein
MKDTNGIKAAHYGLSRDTPHQCHTRGATQPMGHQHTAAHATTTGRRSRDTQKRRNERARRCSRVSCSSPPAGGSGVNPLVGVEVLQKRHRRGSGDRCQGDIKRLRGAAVSQWQCDVDTSSWRMNQEGSRTTTTASSTMRIGKEQAKSHEIRRTDTELSDGVEKLGVRKRSPQLPGTGSSLSC